MLALFDLQPAGMDERGSKGGVCRYFWVALEFVAANRSRGQFINLKFKASAKIENDCELTNDSLSFLLADSGSESGSHKSIREKRPSGPSDGKPTRVRTVLNEKQLHTLR